ncbi:hypothetical protein QAD02_021535 [Eretmocerus hayati]|uniref:Uncharacterized protein n=1 Tax=Eretmocerus hayati TaxID=131215 RepID=A0ACC2PQQ9_9HYME|nr:hypothetical protein QAD02_021535 [Eretmocerus hayati]
MDSGGCKEPRKRKSIDNCSARHQRRLVETERDRSLELVRSKFQSNKSHTPILNAHEEPTISTNAHEDSLVESNSHDSVRVVSTVESSKQTTHMSHDDQQSISLLPENPEPESEFLIDSFNENDLIDDFDYAYRYSDGEDSGYSNEEDDPSNRNNEFEDEEHFLASTEEDSKDPGEISNTISTSLKGVFTHWSIESNISQNAMTKLLHKIRDEVPHLKLPLQAQTLYDSKTNDNPIQQ